MELTLPLRLLIVSQKSFREGLRAAKNFLESVSGLVTAFLGFFYLGVSLGRLLNTTKDTGLRRSVSATVEGRSMVLF